MVSRLQVVAWICAMLLVVQAKSKAERAQSIVEQRHLISNDITLSTAPRRLDQNSSLTCQSLPSDPSGFLCAGLVDYAFHIPPTGSLQSLEEDARRWAFTFPSWLPASCRSTIKQMICAAVYLPCLPTGE